MSAANGLSAYGCYYRGDKRRKKDFQITEAAAQARI